MIVISVIMSSVSMMITVVVMMTIMMSMMLNSGNEHDKRQSSTTHHDALRVQHTIPEVSSWPGRNSGGEPTAPDKASLRHDNDKSPTVNYTN